jgi:outer membrane protein TolC
MIFALLTLLFSPNAFSNDVALMQKVLAEFPGQKLTLNFVATKAAQNSQSFRSLGAYRLKSEASLNAANAPHDWTLFSQYSLFDSKADTSNPFSPTATESNAWQIGARRYFSTGTAAEVKYESAFNKTAFANPTITIPDSYTSTYTLSLRQSLWADAFGSATRAMHKALKRQSEAQELGFQESEETWMMQLIDQYYAAWLAQKQFFAAEENLTRREKLLSTTRLKAQRGTAEAPDLLQVESAHLLAKNSLSQAKAELDHVWRMLVITLGLPETWMAIPPEKIPLDMGEAPSEATRVCANMPAPENTLSVQKAVLQKEAAELLYQKARSEKNPKLELVGAYESNGVNTASGLARKEATERKHPAWSAALQLEIPIGLSAQKSRELDSRADFLLAETQAVNALDLKKVELLKNCDYFRRAGAELKNSLEAQQSQKRRLDLEENRFRLGRSSTFQVIQAGDDKTNVNLASNLNEANLRRYGWRVIQSASKMNPYIEKWKQ